MYYQERSDINMTLGMKILLIKAKTFVVLLTHVIKFTTVMFVLYKFIQSVAEIMNAIL